MTAELFVIESSHLEILRRVRTRLHSEDRLDGDAMRDLGHALDSVIRYAQDFPVPSGGEGLEAYTAPKHD